ncbi:MAG TPA: DUF6798 domain-containing protein [Ardenticatenaceae bacterium]|nr:DUF6798 domain-containing protein [Ardenticatenaceae bacterium]
MFDARRPLGASIPNSVIALTIIVVTLAAARLMLRGEGAPHRVAPTWIRPFARPLAAGAAAIIFLAAVPVIMVLAPAPLDRRIVIADGAPSNDLEDVASWVRSHTAEDASFITSPDSNMAPFTLLAERNTLGDYKLATQSVWDPDFAFVAYERLSDLGCPGPWRPSCRDNSYDSFDAETFHSLSAKYGACFAITSLPQEGDLVEIYHNGSYHVYSLCDARD